jgi:serine protease Do
VKRWTHSKNFVLLLAALLVSNVIGISLGRHFADANPQKADFSLEKVAHAADPAKAKETKTEAPAKSPEAALLKHSSESFRAVAKVMSPSVVVIKASRTMKARPQMRRGGPGPRGRAPGPDEDEEGGSPFGDPFFDLFRHFGNPGGPGGSPFGFGGPQQSPQMSMGSGFIIDKRGYIVTNNHVVDGATKVVVNLPGDEKTDTAAKVIGHGLRHL